MNAGRAFSCYLIGADTLLAECGDILLDKGHVVEGVITSAPRVAQWAQSKNLKVIPQDSGYGQKLTDLASDRPFDYLFSITHLEIIKEDILALPRKMAINFHDGPLPKYAGLNAPVWALIHGEESYGITWHQITPGVDEGSILKQAIFDVAPRETSLSINTKCFAAALESFPMLVDELSSGTEQHSPQDLTQRSYFGKLDRPDGAGILDWNKTADELDRLIRALDFGDYLNPITTPKILFGDKVFSVEAASAGESEASAEPGVILALDSEHILVAAKSGALSLSKFRDLSGKELSPNELIQLLELKPGSVFAVLSETDISALTESNKQFARAEAHWTKRLSELEPAELSYFKNESTGLINSNQYERHSINLSPSVESNTLAHAFGILLARLGRKQEFDIAFSTSEMSSIAETNPGFFSSHALLHLEHELSAAAGETVSNTEQQITGAMKLGAWSKDIIIRHPGLSLNHELGAGTALPIGLSINTNQAIVGTALTLGLTEDMKTAELHFDSARLSKDNAIEFTNQLIAVTNSLQENPKTAANEIELLSQEEKKKILETWNATSVSYDNSECIHHLFEQQVLDRPDATALVFEDVEVSYSELNQRANALANILTEKGIGVDDMVGVHVNRSIDLMVATLGVHKAGAAYVPLDPAFPANRLEYMVEDAKLRLIVTTTHIQSELPTSTAEIVLADTIKAEEAVANPNVEMTSANLAYVIYTSGSTGNPKGVMVEHRNATNFFVGMDDRIEHDAPGTWLAVTSLSFDISVLELFWTLTRGFKVVIYREDRVSESSGVSLKSQKRPMEFGLFMWGNDDGPGKDKYKLMLEGSKYFDQNGFDSVWTPERHFSAFGGPYPNPAVTSAAIAAVTDRISIRSGSIVSPLHHSLRIAEDWSVVDNLSNGRVGLSFASGWQPNDFVIMPQNHKNNKDVMLEQIDTVRKLWRGDKVTFKNPMGNEVQLETLPRPVQKELPTWLTTAGNPETYRMAGERGLNVLTHLLGQSVEEVTEKIRIYRQARKDAGLDPAAGKVSLMLHTFVGDNDDDVRELVREPMKDYLRSAMKLVIDFAWAFPAFKRPGGQDSKPEDIDIKSLSEEETDTILNFAFDRYFETSGLFGTPETCLNMIDRCKGADVDEIACLLDFGVDTNLVMEGLPLLKEVRDRANESAETGSVEPSLDQSWAAQVERHQVTHFQCTPSMARMLGFDEDARTQFPKIKHMMVGGEAFPNSLAKDLKEMLTGRLTNMYGPTETTIWSTTQEVSDPNLIPIGRPIANTDIYILDQNLQPTPVGIPGDLYIGGQGVVRGYLNRPELTAERFIPNPFKNDNSKIYWTGDLAKYRDDGVIEFLGRVDHQVKIRGYRIELGEIESQLGSHESVAECVLLLREDTAGDQRLTAYVVAKGAAPEPQDLREFLRQDLPEYMVPNDVVLLDAMPLTPNGKLDRKQLPAPAEVGEKTTADYAAPENDLEKTIADVWQNTLKLEKVGVNDNFFDIGGHSLLIVRVHQLLKEQVSKPISLTDLYRFPTIKTLTEFLDSDGESNSKSLKKSSERASRRRERLGLRSRGRK